MEQLTKQQIILLALLVSFVSSIASGIVTVSLMDQGNPGVTQTINRVVEKTIQTVSASATSTKETVIIKEDEAVINAITKAGKSIVKIYSNGNFVSNGVMLSSGGHMAAFTNSVYADNLTVILDGGNKVSLAYVSRDPSTGISIFQAEQSQNPKLARAYSGAVLANSNASKLGQSVVLIGGREETEVATGIISSKNENRIKVSTGGNFDSFAVLVNLLGEVVGIKDGNTENSFITSNTIKTYATP
jgi:hypothetical protein